jgi:hypothetical protein
MARGCCECPVDRTRATAPHKLPLRRCTDRGAATAMLRLQQVDDKEPRSPTAARRPAGVALPARRPAPQVKPPLLR